MRKETGGSSSYLAVLPEPAPAPLCSCSLSLAGQARAWQQGAIPPRRADSQEIKVLGTVLLRTERRQLAEHVLLVSPNRQVKCFTLTHLCGVLSCYI